MKKLTSIFQKTITISVLVLMGIVIIILTLELGIVILKEILMETEGGTILDLKESYTIFGLFFNILIGIELYETVKVYLDKNVFHVEIILLVALIALARKVILLDLNNIDPMNVIGLSLLIMVVGGVYFLLKKRNNSNNN